jgi:hypothetical protein
MDQRKCHLTGSLHRVVVFQRPGANLYDFGNYNYNACVVACQSVFTVWKYVFNSKSGLRY